MKNVKKLIAYAAMSLAAPAIASPGGEVCHDVTLLSARTNWNSSVTLPKFDPTLGELVRVRWQVVGNVSGTAAFESLDGADTTISTSLSASITMMRPDSSVLSVVVPVVNNSDTVSAFDGTIDFGGTSGKSYAGLSGSESAASASVAAADIALFTASTPGETISLPVIATGTSSGSGAGNLLLLFSTFASASVTVCYEYTVIPAPAALPLLVFGGLAATRRRR